MILSQFWILEANDFGEQDCFVCIVLWCADLNHNSLVIYGSGGKHCDVESMIARVNENRTLKDKPKLIFMVLQRCDHKMF